MLACLVHRKVTVCSREKERASKLRKVDANPELPDGPPLLAIADGKVNSDSGSDSSSNSSSSSSSSSSRKKSSKKNKKKSKADKKRVKKTKNKKDKKTSKKDKKDKDRHESDKDKRAREKQEDKQREAEIKLAHTVLAKFEPALLGLTVLTQRAIFAQVSPAIKEPLMALLAKLHSSVEEAHGVVAAGGGVMTADVKTIAVDLGHVRRYSALATIMMSLAERGSRVNQ